MDILQAVRKLRPGTVWNLRGEILEQVEDGSPRVSVPTKEELQVVVDSDKNYLEEEKTTLTDKNASTDERLDALIEILRIY